MVSAYLSAAGELDSENKIEEVSDFSQYGLDKPALNITLQWDSNMYNIKVGDYNSMISRYYVCVNDEKVTLASTVQSIGSDAFRECPKLKEIFIPESVTEIDPYAFYMSENVTIYTPAGSYAESFAIENNIPYVNQ